MMERRSILFRFGSGWPPASEPISLNGRIRPGRDSPELYPELFGKKSLLIRIYWKKIPIFILREVVKWKKIFI